MPYGPEVTKTFKMGLISNLIFELSNLMCTPGFRIHGPQFCPDKVDHLAEMTIYPKNLVLKYD